MDDEKGERKKLREAIIKWKHAGAKLKYNFEEGERQADMLMRQCKTFEQLVGAWPEAEQFVKAIPVDTATAIIIRVADMNASLGIE
jgi:hypothetical protein